jgi:hypothetical protein
MSSVDIGSHTAVMTAALLAHESTVGLTFIENVAVTAFAEPVKRPIAGQRGPWTGIGRQDPHWHTAVGWGAH